MGRRRKGRTESNPPEMDERWAVSYLDMMTVLFLTFVVLFSMSSIDAGKYEQLKNALATGFGQEETDLDDTQAGVALEEPATEGDQQPMPNPDPQTAQEKLADIQAGVQENLAEMERQADIEFDRVDGALVIRVLSGETMFTPDDVKLSDSAVELLDGITPVIDAEGAAVSVEGHADYRQSLHYESNWELSADRAVKVVRHMVDVQGMSPGAVSATGFGDTRPMDGKRDMLDRNRRVDIVVMAEDDPEVSKKAQQDKQKDAQQDAADRKADAAGVVPSGAAREAGGET
ncbi:MAG: flagellar motor protein MotB [Micrococcus sp.]|nr:flagellar motor protein MotB [Micrococcus sp.]